MIHCPACGHHNLDGADQCEKCQADLFELGLPENTSTGLAHRLHEDPVLKLRPELSATVRPESTVAEVAKTMIEQHASAVMVVARNKLVGIFTERDLLMKTAHRFDEVADQPIHKFMTSEPETVEAEDSIATGLNRMAVKNYRHIPVMRDGQPVACIRVRDVLQFIADHCPEVR